MQKWVFNEYDAAAAAAAAVVAANVTVAVVITVIREGGIDVGLGWDGVLVVVITVTSVIVLAVNKNIMHDGSSRNWQSQSNPE